MAPRGNDKGVWRGEPRAPSEAADVRTRSESIYRERLRQLGR